MIELRLSPVDGMWRAWAEVNPQKFGPNEVSWICVAVTCREDTALWQGLKVMRKFSPKPPKKKRQRA